MFVFIFLFLFHSFCLGPPTNQQEEAIPSDSLYNAGGPSVPASGSTSWREKQFGSRPSLNGMAHWSSHGYLAKANDNAVPGSKNADGYVVLKRQGDQMVTSLPPPQVTFLHKTKLVKSLKIISSEKSYL